MSTSDYAEADMTLLVLTLSPALEEEIIDYLLGQNSVVSFTSQQVNGHGDHGALSVAEQVSGRRKRVQYQVVLPQREIAALLAGLAASVGKDIEYWEQPIRGYGHIR
ncbi:MAG: DUF3240 family protein [Pseudomonadales bacterium]|nr:DUF3240 family protein [Pseudomonadales bacterium]MCP5356797.1 DUF3240 family protein [Pseudomonadales bacterium]